MIGDHADCPVTIFAGMYVEGDGQVVDRVSISRLFATREAAVADGYGDVQEFKLSDTGKYERVVR